MMNRQMIGAAIALAWSVFCSLPKPAYSETAVGALPQQPLANQAEEVAAYLEGVMTTTQQAAQNTKAPNVQMTTCRITLAGKSPLEGAIALYQEQALVKSLDKPYRQRFLLIAPNVVSQSVQSLSYRPAAPERWSGLCQKVAGTRTVAIAELGTPVCSVFLRQVGSTYIGQTPVGGCPTTARGATYSTNHIILQKTGMETWDRGFDARGKQVWGSTGEAYRFVRQGIGEAGK